MQKISVVAIVVAATGCGLSGQAWDKNGDGRVGQCEGLDRIFCQLTPGCEGQELACIAVCRDDGKGGCGSACPDDFQCVPKPCSSLNAQQCANEPRCAAAPEVCALALCIDHGTGRCDACAGGPVCRDRVSCSNRSVTGCSADPGCELQTEPVCAIYCAPGSDCPPCATPKQRCVARPPARCEDRTFDQCTSGDAGCRILSAGCPTVGSCFAAPSSCVSP